MITKLPNLSKAAKMAMISQKLEKVSKDTIFGIAIRHALRVNDLKRCIEMIKDQAKDNYKLVSEIVGEDLLKEIESL